jgi:hypothetical protein
MADDDNLSLLDRIMGPTGFDGGWHGVWLRMRFLLAAFVIVAVVSLLTKAF